MLKLRKSRHVQYDIKYHIVWLTKYKYKVLIGRIAIHVRELIKQTCKALNVEIITGCVGKNYVYLSVSCPPNLSVSKLVKHLKGRTSKILQSEYKSIQERYWGNRLWATGFWCKSTGYIELQEVRKYVSL